MLAAAAGVALTILLWYVILRSSVSFARKPYASLENGHQPRTLESCNWQHSCDQSVSKPITNNGEAVQKGSEPPDSGVMVQGNLDTRFWSAYTPRLSQHPLHRVAQVQGSPDGTAFFTSPPVMNEVGTFTPMSLPPLQPLLIPAPLWLDAEISPDNISIAQTSAGSDWKLGQGSYGTVCV